jgi:hypothetical protein
MQQIVFMGGQAVGAAIWGLVAQHTGLVTEFAVASAAMALGAATIAVLPLHDTEGIDRSSTVYWPEPQLFTEPEADEGPVLITLTFTVPPENVAPFLEAMQRVRSSRRRTGATRWSLYRDAADPSRFIETFFVPSWGGTPTPTPRTPHRRRSRHRAGRPRARRRSAAGRPPLPRIRLSNKPVPWRCDQVRLAGSRAECDDHRQVVRAHVVLPELACRRAARARWKAADRAIVGPVATLAITLGHNSFVGLHSPTACSRRGGVFADTLLGCRPTHRAHRQSLRTR